MVPVSLTTELDIEAVRGAFRKWDLNDDGEIVREEITKVLAGMPHLNSTPEDIDAVLR